MAMQGSGAGAAPPGWYPDPEGRVRWWDGEQWGPLPQGGEGGGGGTTSDSRTTAMLAHLLGIFTGFLGPLVIYLLNGEKDPFVRHHAAEALNFQLTMLIAWFATVLLMFVLVGLLVAPVLFVSPSSSRSRAGGRQPGRVVDLPDQHPHGPGRSGRLTHRAPEPSAPARGRPTSDRAPWARRGVDGYARRR